MQLKILLGAMKVGRTRIRLRPCSGFFPRLLGWRAYRNPPQTPDGQDIGIQINMQAKMRQKKS